MSKSMKTLAATAVAGMALAGTVMTASAAEPQMPNQQMMTQGQAQGGGAPGAMPGYGAGYGMQRGAGMPYGPGMGGGGYGYGQMHGAYGPGMSGGAYPMGMMGGGMWPGMMAGMGGFGPGAGGMMGGGYGQGYGMGPGAFGPMAMMDLTDAQTSQLEKIQTEGMKKQRALMRQMWDEQEKLADLLSAEKRNPAAIGKAYGKLAELQGQAMEVRVATDNKATEVLTKEQRALMRRAYGHGRMGY